MLFPANKRCLCFHKFVLTFSIALTLPLSQLYIFSSIHTISSLNLTHILINCIAIHLIAKQTIFFITCRIHIPDRPNKLIRLKKSSSLNFIDIKYISKPDKVRLFRHTFCPSLFNGIYHLGTCLPLTNFEKKKTQLYALLYTFIYHNKAISK